MVWINNLTGEFVLLVHWLWHSHSDYQIYLAFEILKLRRKHTLDFGYKWQNHFHHYQSFEFNRFITPTLFSPHLMLELICFKHTQNTQIGVSFNSISETIDSDSDYNKSTNTKTKSHRTYATPFETLSIHKII